MSDIKRVKILVFGTIECSDRRGRPHCEWADDIIDWCGASLQRLSHCVLDMKRWEEIVKEALDTNGH